MDKVLEIYVGEKEQEIIKNVLVKYLQDGKEYSKRMDILDPKLEGILERKIEEVKKSLSKAEDKNKPLGVVTALSYFTVILFFISFLLIAFAVNPAIRNVLTIFNLITMLTTGGLYIATYDPNNINLEQKLIKELEELSSIKANMDKQIDLELADIYGFRRENLEVAAIKEKANNLSIQNLKVFERISSSLEDIFKFVKNSPFAENFFKFDAKVRNALGMEKNPKYDAYKRYQQRPGYWRTYKPREPKRDLDKEYEEFRKRGRK